MLLKAGAQARVTVKKGSLRMKGGEAKAQEKSQIPTY